MFQAIEIRLTTHAEVFTEICTKNFHMVYGSPYFLSKYNRKNTIDNRLHQRLEREKIELPKVSAIHIHYAEQ